MRIKSFTPMLFTNPIRIATLLILACGCVLIGCQSTTTEDQSSTAPSAAETVAATVSNSTVAPPEPTVVIEPGPDAQKQAQEALILAQPGDIIEFTHGKFEFDGTLSLNGVADVTVRGQGMDRTILNFAKFAAGKGKEGLRIQGDRFLLQDLTIEDTPGDAIKLQDCAGITLRRVRTWWTGGPSTKNGAYGLYPVLSTDVLVEECVAQGAADAGIYVGQSQRVIVRDCLAEENVAGIEIENCVEADVYDNRAVNNTAGILVFSLPGLTIKNGASCRVFDNSIHRNNHPNFAEAGTIVSTVPAGTGVMIMANEDVEVFKNEIVENNGAGFLLVSFLIAQRKYDDPQYNPFPNNVSIHDNVFKDGGGQPEGEFLEQYASAVGGRLPDIVMDGIYAPPGSSAPDSAGNVAIRNNGLATIVDLDLAQALLGNPPEPKTHPFLFAAELQPLPPVKLKTE